jgi:hypothetical protein
MATTTVGFDNTPQIGKEYPPVGESEAIEKLRALHQAAHQKTPPGPAERGQHPKQHGGVWATFSVAADIPDEMRVGIFAEPRSYTALVRFSNGGSMKDTEAAVHAMAVKVLVPNDGGSPHQQDFIVADHPVFFARDVQHMFEFLEGTIQRTLDRRKYPALAGFSKVATESLLSTTYWSQTPYRLGTGAVKYMVRPAAPRQAPPIPLSSSENFLREALIEQLTYRKIGANFDLCVHPQTDAVGMPIEDPTVEWKSAPVHLATISIYPQKFNSPEQIRYFENLSWTPWNTLSEHVPLGGINRARKFVYEDSSSLRHKTTGVAPEVPTGRESF